MFRFYDCPELTVDTCKHCISGDSSCYCNVQGRCQGAFVDADADEDCAQRCYQYKDCEFWTFDSLTGICTMYQSCPEVDMSCESCISGAASCYEGKKPPRESIYLRPCHLKQIVLEALFFPNQPWSTMWLAC